MRQQPIWASEHRSAALSAFLESQKEASPGACFVPFKSGVSLEEDFQVATHLANDPHDLSLESMTYLRNGRSALETRGIYDCAAVSLELQTYKLLIHAYGPLSMKYLLDEFENSIEEHLRDSSPQRAAVLQIYGNLSYIQNFPGYELVLHQFLYGRNWRIRLNRHLVGPHTNIKI